MKRFLFFGICILLFFIGFISVISYRLIKTHLTSNKITPTPTPITATPSMAPVEFSNEPPRQSLSGSIVQIDGTIMKLARDVEDPVRVTSTTQILEGEQIIASPSSAVNVQFGTSALITVNPGSSVAFPSTNPANFLIKQDKGITVFESDDQVATISARSLHGLFSLSHGKAQLNVDPDQKMIEFMIVKGTGKIGYIDINNQTQIVELAEGEVALFDDVKRTIE